MVSEKVYFPLKDFASGASERRQKHNQRGFGMRSDDEGNQGEGEYRLAICQAVLFQG